MPVSVKQNPSNGLGIRPSSRELGLPCGNGGLQGSQGLNDVTDSRPDVLLRSNLMQMTRSFKRGNLVSWTHGGLEAWEFCFALLPGSGRMCWVTWMSSEHALP